MKKNYNTPSLDLKIYRLPYNSVFTESGDRLDDDVYDITGTASDSGINNSIFGD